MQQTVSEKFKYLLFDTLGISCLCCTPKVIDQLKLNNLQVTKASNSWVGTSEAIRLLNIKKFPSILRLGAQTKIKFSSNSKNNDKWNEWLGGLIDGDGSFLLTKKGYASLEITMDIRDEHALMIIKNHYGGSIKLRSGANALRYRLHHKSGLLRLIKDVNGNIRNSNRLLQLSRICDKYDLNLIYPDKLTYNNGWLSGFFDSDGTVTINSSNAQLSISIGQKSSELLMTISEIYGGNMYVDRNSQTLKWYITKKEDILKILDYFKNYPPRSEKSKRLHLIRKFYELKDMKAHKALSESILGKSWNYFYQKWLKYEV